MAEKEPKETDDEILELALERFKEIEEYESEVRKLMQDDKKFSLGDQWNENDVISRESRLAPVITIQRHAQFTDFIKNSNRLLEPSIKVSPEDEEMEKEAERRQGLIRHIQYESKAVMARNEAFDDAVDMGRGHYVVKTDWLNQMSTKKKIIVESIQDPLSVYMDINRQKPDYSDCEFGFILKTMRRKEFEKKYPERNATNWNGTKYHKWSTQDNVTLAQYYCKYEKERELLIIEREGIQRAVYRDELKRDLEKADKIVDSRKVTDSEWMWYLLTSEEILDREALPFKEIAIITVLGKEDVNDGKLSIKGLIRDIKDPLRMYNFVASQEAELLSQSTKTRYILAEGQDEGHEDFGEELGAYSIYKPTTFNGQLTHPPIPVPYAGVPTGLVNQKREIVDDCKAITGIYDSSVGARSNETSGVAIKQRQSQTETANYHFTQNSAYGVTHEGRVINSALNVVYDTKQKIPQMNEENENSNIEINGDDEVTLGSGAFGVTVSVGPASDTARQEQAQGMLEMLNKVMLVQNTAADLVVRTQDWKGKDALADRLEYAIEKQIPGITTQTKPEGEDQRIAMLSKQLQQCQDQLQQMTQQTMQLQQALEKAQADKQAAAAGKIQVDLGKLEIEKAKLQLETQKIQGELSIKKEEVRIKEKEVEYDAQKADLDSETRRSIARDGYEVDLIKHTTGAQSEIEKIDRQHEITENAKKSEKVDVKKEASAVAENKMKEIKAFLEKGVKDLQPAKKRETKVTKQSNGKYKFESVDDKGKVTKGTVNESEGAYQIKSNTKEQK